MNLVLLHHHLNPGGVTRVVQNHLLALAASGSTSQPVSILLLHGGRADKWPLAELEESLPCQLTCQTVEGLDYDDSSAPVGNSLGLAIQQAIRAQGWGPQNTLLHWHNHCLGKNAATLPAVAYLAQEGYRLLLQVHDFAEDFRPTNYQRLVTALTGGKLEDLPGHLYPQAPHIHYATLNGRDFQLLSSLGVSDQKLHLLPNPVSPPQLEDPEKSRPHVFRELGIPLDSQLLTYPVRGIRRKNLGEMLLWSTLVEHSHFQLTLTPESPAELMTFQAWKELAAELGLPCRLGNQQQGDYSFPQLIAASDALITTSVAEGFGMVFLEAWLFGKELWGRDLPEISGDFAQAGLNLHELYEGLLVPTTWIDPQFFFDTLKPTISMVYSEFGLPTLSDAELKQEIEEVLAEELVDFARLPTVIQRQVIRQTRSDSNSSERLLHINPKLSLDRFPNQDLISQNAEVVRNNFSLQKIGQHLVDVYATVWNSEPTSAISPPSQGQAILETFLRFDRLHPVRVEP